MMVDVLVMVANGEGGGSGRGRLTRRLSVFFQVAPSGHLVCLYERFISSPRFAKQEFDAQGTIKEMSASSRGVATRPQRSTSQERNDPSPVDKHTTAEEITRPLDVLNVLFTMPNNQSVYLAKEEWVERLLEEARRRDVELKPQGAKSMVGSFVVHNKNHAPEGFFLHEMDSKYALIKDEAGIKVKTGGRITQKRPRSGSPPPPPSDEDEDRSSLDFDKDEAPRESTSGVIDQWAACLVRMASHGTRECTFTDIFRAAPPWADPARARRIWYARLEDVQSRLKEGGWELLPRPNKARGRNVFHIQQVGEVEAERKAETPPPAVAVTPQRASVIEVPRPQTRALVVEVPQPPAAMAEVQHWTPPQPVVFIDPRESPQHQRTPIVVEPPRPTRPVLVEPPRPRTLAVDPPPRPDPSYVSLMPYITDFFSNRENQNLTLPVSTWASRMQQRVPEGLIVEYFRALVQSPRAAHQWPWTAGFEPVLVSDAGTVLCGLRQSTSSPPVRSTKQMYLSQLAGIAEILARNISEM